MAGRPAGSDKNKEIKQFVVTFSDGAKKESLLVKTTDANMAIYLATPLFSRTNSKNENIDVTKIKVVVV